MKSKLTLKQLTVEHCMILAICSARAVTENNLFNLASYLGLTGVPRKVKELLEWRLLALRDGLLLTSRKGLTMLKYAQCYGSKIHELMQLAKISHASGVSMRRILTDADAMLRVLR